MENQKEPGENLTEKQSEQPETIHEVIPEVRLYEKGEGGDAGGG